MSQSAVTGTGTAATPYTVVTVVRAGATGITLTQTDRYVIGNETYDTSVVVANSGPVAQVGTIYTAGDCYLQDSDYGYGRVVGTAPACATTSGAGGRVQQLLPITGGNAYYQAGYSSVWSTIGQQRPFPNTCQCTSYIDNGVGISWPVSIQPGTSSIFEWSTVFSPTGNVPLVVTATADQQSVLPAASDGYTVQLSNGNVTALTADTLTITLPPGFSYTPGSATGITTQDPAVAGQDLTFTGPFSVPASGVVSLHLGVTVATAPGTYTIDAVAQATGFDVNNDLDTAAITVLAVSDLSITKTAGSPTAVAGGADVSFTLEVSNAGPGAATGIIVSDSLPSGMTFVAAGSSPGCFALGGTVTCAMLGLDPGTQAPLTVVMRADATATAGSRVNTATVVAPSVDDTDLSNNAASAGFAVVRESDVGVSKSGPVSANAGSTVSYAVTITNAGPSAAAVTMTDILPTGFTATGISGPGCTLVGGPRCTPTVQPGSPVVATITGTVAPDAGPTILNAAQVTTTSTDPNLANDTATATTTVTPVADLSLSSTLQDDPVAGSAVRYRLVATNNGPSQATAVQVTYTLPPGTTLVPALSSSQCLPSAGDVLCSLPTLAPGGSNVFFVGVSLPSSLAAGADLASSAVVTATEPDPVPGNNTATTSDPVSRAVDLSLTKSVAAPSVLGGGPVEFTLVLKNPGVSDASNVLVSDPAIAGVTWGSATVTSGEPGSCAVDSGDMQCVFPSVAAGTTSTITLLGTADADPTPDGQLRNTATVTAAEPELNDLDNTAFAVTGFLPDAGLEVTKVAQAGSAVAGGPLDYTITVVNRGPSTAPGVILTDILPAELVSPSVTSPPGSTCDIAAGVLTCDLGDLPADPGGTDPVEIPLSATVDPAVPGGSVIVNEATATDTAGEAATGTETTDITRESTYTVDKTALTVPMVAGSTGRWELRITNQGPSVGSRATLVESPETGFTVTSITGSGATCNLPSLTCDVDDLEPGQSIVLLVDGSLDPDLPTGSLDNSVALSNPQGPGADGTATITVVQSSDLSVVKSSELPTVTAGTAARYPVEVSNSGPSTATGVTVTDTLPAGLTFEPTASSDGCTAVGQDVTCTVGTLVTGASRQLVIGTVSDPGLDTTLDNTATVQGDQPDPDPTDDASTASTTFAAPTDLSVTKTATSALAGQDLTWTIRVTDLTAGSAQDVVVTDTVSPDLTFVSATASDGSTCTFDAGLLSCPLGSLSPGDVTTVTVVTATAPDLVPDDRSMITVNNHASVITSTPDVDPNNDSAEAIAAVAAAADLTPTKDGPSTALAGDVVQYTVTATNAGPSAAPDAVVEDRLVPNLQFLPALSDPACQLTDPGTNTVTCAAAAPLAAGAEMSFTIAARADATLADGSVLVNTATASSTRATTQPQEAATVSTEITASADVSITKTPSAPAVSPGSSFTYSLTITNAGPSAAYDIQFSDDGPGTFLSGGVEPGTKGLPSCPVGRVLFQCRIPQLMPGEAATFTIPVVTDPTTPEGTVIENHVSITSATPDPDTTNNAATSTVVIAASPALETLDIEKTASQETAAPGDRITWTIAVSNPGQNAVDSVVVTDQLPHGLTVDSTSSQCVHDAAGTVSCDLGRLEPGGSARVTIDSTVDALATGTLTNTASVTAADSPQTSASATVQVGPSPGPSTQETPPTPGTSSTQGTLPWTGLGNLGPLLVTAALLILIGAGMALRASHLRRTTASLSGEG